VLCKFWPSVAGIAHCGSRDIREGYATGCETRKAMGYYKKYILPPFIPQLQLQQEKKYIHASNIMRRA
jgi:hypothetical protein